MSEKRAQYITTTLPYVNAEPHAGFALEVVQADTLARYYRLLGHPVFFSTGTDEHGQKIAQKAESTGQTTQAYVDHYAETFTRLKESLNLSYDNFIRTTDSNHIAAAQEMWRRCANKGDIYKKKYTGLYCVGDEMFVKESDLVNGRCPNHPDTDPVEIEEENYFFKLSKYQDKLLAYFENESSTVPDWQRKWAIEFVKNGLEDLSISRQKDRMSWGVPVPDDDSQVMYVWFDALTNYISTLGWPKDDDTFKKFWVDGKTTQFAGKDQVRFQSIIWQAMLLSAEIPQTDTVFYHGFITSEGKKMSKSIGNVISPSEMVNRYGTEATRYILLRHVHPYEDTDISWERMDEWYTANLVNGLGNLTARIMKMAETHLEPEDFPLLDPDTLDLPDIIAFQPAMDHIWTMIQGLDERITTTEPFKLIKTNPDEAKLIMGELRAELLHIGRLLLPSMPETSNTIRAAVRANQKPDNLFARLDT